MSRVSVEILNKSLLEQDVDAIVNPANPRLLHGGGLCGVIYDAVLKSSKNGYGKLIKSISALPVYGDSEMQIRCPYGYAVETPVEGLIAKYIIHTVGAIDGHHTVDEQREILGQCYYNCFMVAKRLGLKSIAVPMVSAGLYGCDWKVVYNAFKSGVVKFREERYELGVKLCMVDNDMYEGVVSQKK